MYKEMLFEDESWGYSEDYTVLIENYELENVLKCVKELNDNPNVYTDDDGVEKFANGEFAEEAKESIADCADNALWSLFNEDFKSSRRR